MFCGCLKDLSYLLLVCIPLLVGTGPPAWASGPLAVESSPLAWTGTMRIQEKPATFIFFYYEWNSLMDFLHIGNA